VHDGKKIRVRRCQGIDMSPFNFIKNFFSSNKLTELERRILLAVRASLPECVHPIWDSQVLGINKIQRLPGGVEVDFYRMRGGRPVFENCMELTGKNDEHLLAEAIINALSSPREKLIARIWCVKGVLFSIEYDGSCDYYEALAKNNEADLTVHCQEIHL
jgi:hypothetical protein